MIELDKRFRIAIGVAVFCLCFLAGVFFAYVYQPPAKTMKVYAQAMKDFEDGDFQNSYYLYSKISYMSNLKPVAIYHQAECAKALGDKKSELKQYHLLFNNYPKHKLSLRAKYSAAQMLVDENPKLAKKYFEQIIKEYPESDFAIASEYYLGVIILKKHIKNPEQIFSVSEKNAIEMAFRHYLQKAPQGRLALNAIINWLSLDKEIESDDYLLMAKSSYLFGDYENTRKLLVQTDLKDSWVLGVKNAYATGDFSRAKYLAIYGIQNYAGYVEDKDIYDAVDVYLKMSNTKKADIDYIFNISGSKGKDYIWSFKCYNAPVDYQAGCFKQLYLNFPNSEYGADALANLFFDRVRVRDYNNAVKIGKDYLNKFKDSSSAPMVMFWLGKIAEKQNRYDEYMGYYKSTMAQYPDTFYAYRAYISMKHINTPLLNAYVNSRPVEYPYDNISKKDVISKLVELKDYDMISELTDDEFVKSWIYYQKGDYSHSMLVARDAMDKLKPKPNRSDLRWRLVYPVNYYDEIQKYAKMNGNNSPLMLALIREESYFNPNAQSAVGARGLMQIMPATAKEISNRSGYGIVDVNELYNPELNIKIGNAYYSQLRSNLNNLDISSIAAYNGGIGSINKWQKNIIYGDTDEFIEQIPYSETKNYVKKVFRSYWNYLRIYAEE